MLFECQGLNTPYPIQTLTLIRDSLPPDERAKEPEVGDLKQDMELEGGLASAGGVKKPKPRLNTR